MRRFEIDINLTSWECTGNHKLSLFLSLRVEIYCFIWGSCLEKVIVFFLLLLIYLPSYLFYKVACNKCGNWNLFWFITHIEVLVSFSYNIGKVLVLKERHTYYFSNYFPVFFQSFPVLCNLSWGEWKERYWSSVAPRGLLRIVSHIPSLRASAYSMYSVLRI